MKHILLAVTALFFTLSSFGQCTPDPQYATNPPGLYPDGPLGPTCELTAAKTIVSLTDTLLATPLGTATFFIQKMKVLSVTGLPPNLELYTNVGTGTGPGNWGEFVNGGTYVSPSNNTLTSAVGCAYVQGTQGAWDAAIGGGPNNDGVYPVEFLVDAFVLESDNGTINFFIGTDYWISTIDPSQGGGPIPLLDTLVIPADYADISTPIQGATNIDPFTPYAYSVPASQNVTYNWTVTNGTIISGQGTNEVMVEWNGSGTIEVDLTDGGCQGNDTRAVTANPTGLDEVSGINASIYPNPSNGVFNLQLESTDAIDVRILDVSGKVLRSQQLAGSNIYTVDMTYAPAGVYILELESAEGITFKRMIKN